MQAIRTKKGPEAGALSLSDYFERGLRLETCFLAASSVFPSMR